MSWGSFVVPGFVGPGFDEEPFMTSVAETEQ